MTPHLTLLGVPSDAHASFLRGPARAPARIRAVLQNGAGNAFTESGVELRPGIEWHDAGDITLPPAPQDRAAIEDAARQIIDAGGRLLTLGGDHAITYPLIRAHAPRWSPLTIVQIDAHPDLYDELDGDRYSHACPFARIMEDGLAQRLIQIGIRAMTRHQREQAERFRVEVIEMRQFSPSVLPTVSGPIYLSFDLDGLDPAFAPGVSHHEPGGLSVRDALAVIHGLGGTLIGADLVEYNPARDVHNQSAAVAAKLVKELLGRMMNHL
jgi:agmatinase